MPTVTYVGRCGSCGRGVAVSRDVELLKVLGRVMPFEPETRVPLGDVMRELCVCGHPTKIKRVAGEVNLRRACDERCTNATGADCSCSCGGSNHGRAHIQRRKR